MAFQLAFNNTNYAEISNTAPLFCIAGPCAIESRAHALETALALKEIFTQVQIPLIYKSSFDKANRTSQNSYRGPGLEKGMKILASVREEAALPVITDIHTAEQAEPVAETVDFLQIPAFLCRQTDLLIAAAQTGKPISIKKGQFLAPWDMQQVYNKVSSINPNICLCERGSTFGYGNLVVDMRGLEIMKSTGAPVIFDATHSVQQPGGLGICSGGQREYVPTLLRAAIAVGVAGIFMEVHHDPDKAPCDGPNMLPIKELPKILSKLQQLDSLIKEQF